MCWKHEWAKAINNLNWAKIHVLRARTKVQKRGMDNATKRCDELLKTLTDAQQNLKCMIDSFGISKKTSAPSLDKLMSGSRKKRGKVEAWVNTN